MNIMNFLKIILGSLLLFASVGCKDSTKNTSAAKETKEQIPNIIFIMADDLGYADISPYGQKAIKTPVLEQMAKEGMRFTQHYAGNTVCAPSRCALMTGMHMGNAQVRGNGLEKTGGQPPLTPEAITVAKLLKNVGYETALIGKWGLGNEATTGSPLKQGFDSYYGYLDQVLAHNYYPEYLLRNGKKEMLANEVVYRDSTEWHGGLGSHSKKQEEYSHDLFIEEALGFIEKERENPFFLYLPFTIPHNNGEAPEGFRMEVPDMGIYSEEEWPRDTKAYAAMITRMDRGIGLLIDKLKEKGIDQNTVIFFTSDNGPMPGEHFTELFDSNGPLKGGKRDLYEGGIRVPFLARWPGTIIPNSTSQHISAFWDFLPTACDLAGIDTPKNIDGISYLPALLQKEQPKHEYLYWEFPEKGYSVGLRKGKWKAVRRNMNTNPNSTIELYNLETDLQESNNIAAAHPEIVRELTQLLTEARTPSERFPMPGE